MTENALRNLPSIDQLLRRDSLRTLISEAGRAAVRDGLREVIDELRHQITAANGGAGSLADTFKITAEIEARLQSRFASRRQAQLQRVINATGVVLHTNLGRAPLSRSALAAINRIGEDYCNLEYDLATGRRGKRDTGFQAQISQLLNCEAAAVVNNCAAAVLLVLNTLAEGGEVIVSRGELVEIGGSFRIPDVIAKSGARLREVGTTNRTRISDYKNAIGENTRILLRTHTSNYRIIGFTEKPELEELAQLAREHGLPLFEDLGSGCLVDLGHLGIQDEPTVEASLKAGCSLVAFSGDKLLGGPQAGIIVGEAELIGRIKSNPLMRALRVDKLTYAALEATIASYAAGRAIDEVPALAALNASRDNIKSRARAFIRRAKKSTGGLRLNLIDGVSLAGGGSAPETQLPTALISVESAEMNAAELEERLRRNEPPVIARIVEGRLMLDLRTVSANGEKDLLTAIGRL
ncbi:MAG: L-seryl-tRNA(Sec) selenium transferase [Blastocatellia bacterium]|nr:L-seryl-tRNA(Sec) selenium transferase [Blastocatellia bacterium]